MTPPVVKYKQGGDLRFDETGVYVNGELVGTLRKRTESYTGIRGSSGRRLGRYTYFDFYSRDEERTKFTTGSTRKVAVAEALARLGYYEAAYWVDPSTGPHWIRQSGRCAASFMREGEGAYLCTREQHAGDNHDGFVVRAG